MKITKRQLRRIIREEKSKILSEDAYDENAAYEFEELMVQIGELVEEAFEVSGRPEAARGYWYNGMLGYINPEQYGIMSRSTSMADTLEEMKEGGNEDMMEMGYNDGAAGNEPAHPDNEFYMSNYEDGQREAEGRP
jgi:hypothetical protein